MPDEGPSLDEIRIRLIQLLGEDRVQMTEREQVLGRRAMGRSVKYPTEYSIYDHILKLLRSPACPIHEVALGEPPGSGGRGYVVKDPADPSLYIKLKIEDEGFGDQRVLVMSFHISKHAR
jgi:hypothetical protein